MYKLYIRMILLTPGKRKLFGKVLLLREKGDLIEA